MIGTAKIALYIDFENFFNGVGKSFKIKPVIEYLREYGSIRIRKAYGDWLQHADFREQLIEHGIELIEQTCIHANGKNGADIKLAIDAMEEALQFKEINTFAIASGDSDFLPLVTKLRKHGKYVIVISSRKIASEMLQKNCDEFIAYEIFQEKRDEFIAYEIFEDENGLQKAIDLFLKAIRIRQEKGEELDIAQHKNQMLQLDPSFDEKLYGFKKFSDFITMIIQEGKLPYHVERKPDTQAGFYILENNAHFDQPEIIQHQAPISVEGDRAKLEGDHDDLFTIIPEGEWVAFIDTVEKCIKEGEGKFLKGKQWIIKAYLHRNAAAFTFDSSYETPALHLLVEHGVLKRVGNDVFHLGDDFKQKKEAFLQRLRGSS